MSKVNKENMEKASDAFVSEKIQELAKKEKELQAKQNSLEKREEDLNKRQTEYNKTKNELNEEKQQLEMLRKEVEKKNKENLQIKQDLDILKLEAENGFPKLLDERFQKVLAGIKTREENCLIKETELMHLQSELEKEKKNLEMEKEKAVCEFEKQKLQLQAQASQNNAEKEKLKEYYRLEFENDIVQMKQDFEKKLDKEYWDKKDELEKLQVKLNVLQKELQNKKILLEEQENNLEKIIAEKMSEERAAYFYQKQLLQSSIKNYQEQITSLQNFLDAYDILSKKLGDDPEVIYARIKAFEQKQFDLKSISPEEYDSMAELLNKERSEKQKIEAERDALLDRNAKMQDEVRLAHEVYFDKEELQSENSRLKKIKDSYEMENNRLQSELKRIQSIYEREEDREERIRQIESCIIHKDYELFTDISESEWLDEISKKNKEYEFNIPRRILEAFHTSLKIAEWSPITVLAGVSGTGKSELPRIYSTFGGLNFINCAVQPNWDSQEAMLGYFNSIDNKFDAQPVLRFLVQSQMSPIKDDPVKKYGMKNVMNLVLLDEMNLAHVELYFAEFLSKLEQRRAKTKNDLPVIEVKLGAGIQPYLLPLGRNVLWVGTMNQDETTKSLSDKVLDRGVIINFPRPKVLERRTELKPLPASNVLLKNTTWAGWVKMKSIFTGEKSKFIEPYKLFVEEINSHLSTVGRAVGHRVWQSIEYYISNHPRVLASLDSPSEFEKNIRIAFEDQLVQKVMPKLRGIETRGAGYSACLEPIQQMLSKENYDIVKDFDLACKLGYGQFIWNSATYLDADN